MNDILIIDTKRLGNYKILKKLKIENPVIS